MNEQQIRKEVDGLILKSIDELKVDNTRQHKEIISHQIESNHRLSKLENWRNFLIGAWATVMILSGIMAYLMDRGVITFGY